MPQRATPSSHPVVIRPQLFGRLLLYVNLVAAVAIAFGGLAFAVAGPGWDHVTGAVVVVVGLGGAVLCVFGCLTRVRCDHRGVHIHGFRTTFIPVSEIDHLIVASIRVMYARGGTGISPAVVVVRKDGSEVPLESAIRVPFNQPKTEAHLREMAERMQTALGLELGPAGTIPVRRSYPPPAPLRKRIRRKATRE
jgi:hypothetical protein